MLYCQSIRLRHKTPRKSPDVKASGGASAASSFLSDLDKIVDRRLKWPSPTIQNRNAGQKTEDAPSISNKKALLAIISECRDRTVLRVEKPAKQWTASQGPNLKAKIDEFLTNATVSRAQLQKPIAIGDLVLILDQNTKLHLVVALPPELGQDTYTFLSEDGEILYGPKGCIKLRVPDVLPSQLVESLNLITMEEKYPGVAPSGMPDSTFSKGTKTNPLERKKWRRDRDNLEESTAPLASEASLHNVGDDLLVAQATSQFLTDTGVNTFIVPSSARDVYAKLLRNLSIESFLLIAFYAKRLDLFYRSLDENIGEQLVLRKRTFSLFELYQILTGPSFQQQESCPVEDAETSKIAAAHYVALLSSIRKSSRTWRIEMLRSIMMPVGVTAITEQFYWTSEIAKMELKSKSLVDFANFYVNFLKGENARPSSYNTIVQALKSFVANDYANDQVMTSLMSVLVKKIDVLRDMSLPEYDSKAESVRSKAYEILKKLNENKEQNPESWSSLTKTPYTQANLDADLLADYLDFFDVKFVSHQDNTSEEINENLYLMDPLAEVREDFGDTPVYCIDSATAHEIDDGISISETQTNYVISVHIANPTSFIKPESKISELALEMGSTCYNPEGPIMMLPFTISQMCGLEPPRREGESKRTLAIQFSLEKTLIDNYLNDMRASTVQQPPVQLAEKIQQNILQTVQVKAFNAKNFPKHFTYDHVNKILNSPENMNSFAADTLPLESHEANLFKLYHISSILRHIRMKLGKGLEINNPNSSVMVDYLDFAQPNRISEVENGWSATLDACDDNKVPKVTVTNNPDQNFMSKSQQLVSNFMITANFAGAHFANTREIPFIYKEQSLNMSDGVRTSLERITRDVYENGQTPDLAEQSSLGSVLTTANFTTSVGSHTSLGLELYLNLTSPLRRYVDLVNHWNLQLYLLRDSDNCERYIRDIEQIVSKLQYREFMNRATQRLLNKFWICRFLDEYFKAKTRGTVDVPITFSFVLRSDAKYGDVKASMIEFTGINVTIIQNEYLLEEFKKQNLQVGNVVQMQDFRVVSLNSVEGELIIEFI